MDRGRGLAVSRSTFAHFSRLMKDLRINRPQRMRFLSLHLADVRGASLSPSLVNSARHFSRYHLFSPPLIYLASVCFVPSLSIFARFSRFCLYLGNIFSALRLSLDLKTFLTMLTPIAMLTQMQELIFCHVAQYFYKKKKDYHEKQIGRDK